MYLLTALGLCCCSGFTLVEIHRLLIAVASHFETWVLGLRASVVEAPGL